MPAVEHVIGLEVDLTNVTDVAVQEAIEAFASHLRSDNEHNRVMDHLVSLLGPWADRVTATAMMDGEHGKYALRLIDGRIVPGNYTCGRDIVVINPHAAVAGDPLTAGRPRQKLEAIDRSVPVDRLLRALAHPSNARGEKGASEVREKIFSELTCRKGVAVEDALIRALATEDNDVIDPVITTFVRNASLLRRLPDALLDAYLERRELVVSRILKLADDLELSADWLAKAPPQLRDELARRRKKPEPEPSSDVVIDAPVDQTLLAKFTTGAVRDRYFAVQELTHVRNAKHVPTFLAALAHDANRGKTKQVHELRAELYDAIAWHEAPVVRAALLAGLRDESDEVASRIIYVAWRQERLLAELPAMIQAASASDRFRARLVELQQSH